MKFRFLAVPAIAALMFAFPAAATEIATVNIQQIMHDSLAAKSVKDQLEAKQKTFQSEMSRKEQDLQKEYQDLGKQRSVLSPDAFEKKSKEFQRKASITQKDAQTKRAELDNAFSSSLTQIQKAVFGILKDMAKEKGFILVVPSTETLYSDPSLDVTQDVLTRLNKTLPSLTVDFKAPAAEKEEE